jgi:hypothetical protein
MSEAVRVSGLKFLQNFFGGSDKKVDAAGAGRPGGGVGRPPPLP